jgi:hypothetical protein
MRNIMKILLFFLPLFLLAAGNTALGQVRGDNYLKWYSWNASGGFIMPLSPFATNLASGIDHRYHFAGSPGYIFSIAKPIILQVVVGADLEDQRMEGRINGFELPGADTTYNLRLRTYSLFAQYYITPNQNINPFILAKIGYSGINRALITSDLSRTFPANRWDFLATAGLGATWHAGTNFSVNLYGEFTPVPDTYLYELFKTLPESGKKYFPMTRIVLSLTGYTDIRVFYPLGKEKVYKSKYKKTEEYTPFHRVKSRK